MTVRVGVAHVLGGGDEESGGAAGGVADLVSRGGGGHVDHELDDVAGGAELAVLTGGGDLGQHVLVQVAVGVAVVHGHVVEHVHHPRQQGGCGDGEAGVLHVLGVGRPIPTEAAQEREHLLANGLMHHPRFEVLELRPAQQLLAGAEDRILDRLAGAAGLAFGQGLKVVETADEQQVGDLLDHLERVRDPAGPERVPDSVDLAAQFPRDHGEESSCGIPSGLAVGESWLYVPDLTAALVYLPFMPSHRARMRGSDSERSACLRDALRPDPLPHPLHARPEGVREGAGAECTPPGLDMQRRSQGDAGLSPVSRRSITAGVSTQHQ